MSMTYKIEVVGEDKTQIQKLFEGLKDTDFSLRLINLTTHKVIDEVVHGDDW